MTDIFVRTRTRNPIRLDIAAACLRRLELLDGAKVTPICARGYPLPDLRGDSSVDCLEASAERFHIESRELARDAASGDVYVVIDDDCMPIGKDWLKRGLEAMAAYPQFSALASWSINGEIIPEKCAVGDTGLGLSTAHPGIFEVESLGTPTFIRRLRPGPLDTRVLIDLMIPEGSLGQYDGALSRAYLEHGRIGMMRHVRHNHLGYGLSEVVPEWWLA